MFPISADRSRLVFEACPSVIWLCQPDRGRLCSCIPWNPLTMSPHTLATYARKKHISSAFTDKARLRSMFTNILYSSAAPATNAEAVCSCSIWFHLLQLLSWSLILNGGYLLFFGPTRRDDPHFKILHVPFGKRVRLLGTNDLKIQSVGLRQETSLSADFFLLPPANEKQKHILIYCLNTNRNRNFVKELQRTSWTLN